MDLQIAEDRLASFPWDCKGIYITEDKTGCFPFEWHTFLLNIVDFCDFGIAVLNERAIPGIIRKQF